MIKQYSIFVLGIVLFTFSFQPITAETLRYHELKLDAQNKIIPWYSPAENAFDNYLRKCWEWAIAVPKDNHGLPISYLYCAWKVGNPPTIDYNWENDVGEKIPNWVESARLFYQYTGDMSALTYVKGLVDYSLAHGQTPSNHAWPDFPVGTSNAGDTEFRGFTGVWKLWDCHVDLAADIAWSLTRMYEIYGDQAYLNKAKHVADLLAANIQPGNETNSPWPYVINSLTGANKSRYAASWDGALMLFDYLIENNQGNTANYIAARTMLTNWLLTYPMQNGKWVDGHSDVYFDGNTNLSTTCASDMLLYMIDKPGWNPNYTTDIPKLFKWIEDNFVNDGNYNAFPGKYYGAWVPGEQVAFTVRMGYQSARVGGMAAQWFLKSGDQTYKDLGYRCLSFNTYMMQSNGQSSDGPTNDSGWWWSDCYGEAPRMYYYGMGAVPEWAPTHENDILYSHKSLNNVSYTSGQVSNSNNSAEGTEYLRLNFQPASITLQGGTLSLHNDLNTEGYSLRDLGNGDYALTIKRTHKGSVIISKNQNTATSLISNESKFKLIYDKTSAQLRISAPANTLIQIYNASGKTQYNEIMKTENYLIKITPKTPWCLVSFNGSEKLE